MNEKAPSYSILKGPYFTLAMKALALITCLVLLLASCTDVSELIQAPPGDTQASPTSTIADTPRPSSTATLIPTPFISPTPQHVVLAVPTRWTDAALKALEEVHALGSPWQWQLDIHDDPDLELMLRSAQIALVAGSEGTFSGQRPLALVVPFTSQWESITLAEAQQVLTDGSPFIAVMDWADMPATHKALKIDGLRPGDSGYPVTQSWSLVAAVGYETAAAELASALGNQLSKDTVVSLTAVGDVMLDRALGDAIHAGKVNYPFAEMIDLLTPADLTIGNLESALGDLGSPADKGYTFRAPPQAAEALAQAGFDLLSLANNHALDYGPLALQQAMDLLHQQGIATVGASTNDTTAHEPYVHEAHGLTLAFLSYVHVPIEVRGF
ncbi:MAG: CapA family protein, partial [Anaerolineaceae bacterium]